MTMFALQRGHAGVFLCLVAFSIQASRHSEWKPCPYLSALQAMTETSQPSAKSSRQIEHSLYSSVLMTPFNVLASLFAVGRRLIGMYSALVCIDDTPCAKRCRMLSVLRTIYTYRFAYRSRLSFSNSSRILPALLAAISAFTAARRRSKPISSNSDPLASSPLFSFIFSTKL